MLKKLSRVSILVACSLFPSATCLAQLEHQQNSSWENSLRKFLRDYVGNSDEGKTTRYSSAFVDLKDDGTKEVIVYLSGRAWCGTGGCTMLILSPEGTSYRVVTKTTVTRLPIRVLDTKSNGWHDISVVARINGIEPLYETMLPFDAETYPSNPSMSPARRLDGKVHGKIVMPVTAEGTPLYQ
jgi:hypothetical protein